MVGAEVYKYSRVSLVIYQVNESCYNFFYCLLLNLQYDLIGFKKFTWDYEIMLVFIKMPGILSDLHEVIKFKRQILNSNCKNIATFIILW